MKSGFTLVFLFTAIQAFGQSGDTIRTASGLKVLITTQGKGKNPVAGQKLMVHYEGKFADGEVFESSYEIGEPIVFQLGNKEVIEGWEEGFTLLNKGSKAVFVIQPSLGYGDEGVRMPDNYNSFKIPPNTELIYKVELISYR